MIALALLGIFAAGRLVSSILLAYLAAQETRTPWFEGCIDFVQMGAIWDSQWYKTIAFEGYPSELPRDAEGRVLENAWAFQPGYAVLVRLVMLLTGASWELAAGLVSAAATLGTTFALYALLRRHLARSAALFAVAAWSLSPLAALGQIGQADALAGLLLVLLLLLAEDRRWLATLPLVAALTFIRPIVLPWALMLGLYFFWRCWRGLRGRERLPRGEAARLVVTGLITAGLGFAWLAIAAAVTGDPAAYLETEHAWRRAKIGDTATPLFTPWFIAADERFGQPAGTLTVLAAIALFAAALALPAVRRLGWAIWTWTASYLLYLLAVYFPLESVFRMLYPTFPAWGAIGAMRQGWLRALLLATGIGLQFLWLSWTWYYRPEPGMLPWQAEPCLPAG